MSLRNPCPLEYGHESHTLSDRRSTSMTAAPSSHTLSGQVTPTSTSWAMSPAQADLYKSRARNRASAGRCRVKRRNSVANLKVRDREVTEEREELEETASLLRHEVISLKEELIKHAHCDCAMIREYLTLEAQKIVENARRAAYLSPLVSHTNDPLPGQIWNDGDIPGHGPATESHVFRDRSDLYLDVGLSLAPPSPDHPRHSSV